MSARGGCERLQQKCRQRSRVGHGPERLEARLLLTAGPAGTAALWQLSHGVCGCPVCSGLGLDTPAPAAEVGSGPAGAASPLSSLPLLSSHPTARARLYLDFDGHSQASWGAWSHVVTPAYDLDGDPTTFNASELAAIYEIWARVAEDFAPFQIDVTTIAPQSQANGVVAHVVIGGSWSDWFGSPAGGVAYLGGFYNSAPNVAYVFENNLGNGYPRYVAEAVSHEAGHLFGLDHQALWNGSSLADYYHPGSPAWAPIMGVGYYAARTTWHYGPTAAGPNALQDDMALLAGPLNGFGYRPDDHGDTLATATPLPITGGQFQLDGLIHQPTDLDVFSFTTTGGLASFQLRVAPYGPNLDAVLELWNASGQVLASHAPSTSFGASLSLTLDAGTYYVVARSSGGYGNVGQYTLEGTIAGATAGSPLRVQVAGSVLTDGATSAFGTTAVGTPVQRVFTLIHSGTEPVTLQSLAGCLPTGFSLAQDLGQTTLAPGASTQCVVQLDATLAGSYSGSLVWRDADTGQPLFTLHLSGTVTDPETPLVRTLDNGDAGYQRSGSWSTLAGRGHAGDLDLARKGNGSSSASWTFGDLPAGQYRVWVTWSAQSKNASNAPFTVLDGTIVRSTVRINERLAPSGLTADGTRWRLLTTVAVHSGRLTVRLTNAANGQVVADAVRIERVASIPASSRLSRQLEVDSGPESVLAGIQGLAESFRPSSRAGWAEGSGRQTFPAFAGPGRPLFDTSGRDRRAELELAGGRRDGAGIDGLYAPDWEATVDALAQHSFGGQRPGSEEDWAVDRLLAEEAVLEALLSV